MSYDERRLEVTKAAWRVIAREGLDRASMRAIAQELGCSTGVVTHYFRNKEELTLFALDQVFDNILTEMMAHIEGLEGIQRLEEMLSLALPLETSDREDWTVWVAFLGYSIGREPLIQAHQKRYDALREVLCQEMFSLQTDNVLRSDIDLNFEANALIALVDGISTGVVICPEQFSPEQQRQLVKRHISNLAR